MNKPSYFRALAMYFDIEKAQTTRRKAALTSKWFKIQCLSPKHEDKSKDSSNLPKEETYINIKTNKEGKSLMKCFSCNNTLNWQEYIEATKKVNKSKTQENYNKLYELIENRSNINNPIEFLLKLLSKYQNVKKEYIENFKNNKILELEINGEIIKLKPNEILNISVEEFNTIKESIFSKDRIGRKVYETLYLYENETPQKKAKRILENNKKYLEEKEIKKLKEIINNEKNEDKLKLYKELNEIEKIISKKNKEEWQLKEKNKTEIIKYIFDFYKENGKTSEYFKKRGLEEKILKENNILEINNQNLINLKNNLIKRYKKEILLETGILGNTKEGEKFIFETHGIIVPLMSQSYLRGIQFRCTAKTDSLAPGGTRFKTLGSQNSNFWENEVSNYTKVIIMEGYSDAMSMASILKKLDITDIKIIGVANATNPYNRLLNNKLKDKEIYFLLDNDSAGKSATIKLFNEMINGLEEGKYQFRDISSILENKKDLNEYYQNTDIEKIKEELEKLLNDNKKQEINILKNKKETEKIIDDNTIIDLDNLQENLVIETSSKKYIKLNISQQIEKLFEGKLSITNKNYTKNDIEFINDFIYDKELYKGHKELENKISKNFTYIDFIKEIQKNQKLKKMYKNMSKEEFELLKKEYLIIKEIHQKTNIKNLDIFQYFTNMQQPIEYMLKNKIPFTLRGSAGASVILSRQIRMFKNTNAFDPVKHKDFIDFERFLNIDRKDSLPDIDIDVASEFREEIRNKCNFYIPKTKSGSKHLSRSYPIKVKIKGEELKNKDLPISDRYLEKYFPSFDILAMSMQNMEEIFDFTNLESIDKDSFFLFADNYLHVNTSEDELAGKIYHIIKNELKTSNDFISLAALNKTPFNANNFQFTKQYVERLKKRKEKTTKLDFLKNTNGFIIYQEQLLKYLELINIEGSKRQKIRKLNAKPHQLTPEQKQEIEDIFNEVKEAAYNYKGENAEEVKEIFETQYINLKYNAYIFNFPHAVAYHNINMNIYFNEMDKLIKKIENQGYKIKAIKKATEEEIRNKYPKLNITEINLLKKINLKDYEKLKEEKKKQQEASENDENQKEVKILEEKKEKSKNQNEIETNYFLNKISESGQKYFILKKEYNKILEKYPLILEKNKTKIRYYSDIKIYTIWNQKIKEEIESIIDKEKHQNIILEENFYNQTIKILNRKFNSDLYKEIKNLKNKKSIKWIKILRAWEIKEDAIEEVKELIIKKFPEYKEYEIIKLPKKIKEILPELIDEELIKRRQNKILIQTNNFKNKEDEKYSKKLIKSIEKNVEEEIPEYEEEIPEYEEEIPEYEEEIPEYEEEIPEYEEEIPEYEEEIPEYEEEIPEYEEYEIIKLPKKIKEILPELIDEELIKRNNKKILIQINNFKNKEDEEYSIKLRESIKQKKENKIRIENTKKWVKISGKIEESIVNWIEKTLIEKNHYQYIKLDKEKNILIQIADFNEIGKENLDFNFELLSKIKRKMNYVEESEEKIKVKIDKDYIKIQGNLSKEDKVYLETFSENQIFYHEKQNFWSIPINQKFNLTKEQIEENLKIYENIKNTYNIIILKEEKLKQKLKG